MQLENVIMDFHFFLIWKYAKHSLWGGCSAAAQRKLPDGNNQSHKNGILISFLPEREREGEREARPSSGLKLIAPLRSHLLKCGDEDAGSPTLSPDEIQLRKGGVGRKVTLQQLHFSTLSTLLFFSQFPTGLLESPVWRHSGPKLGFNGLKKKRS